MKNIKNQKGFLSILALVVVAGIIGYLSYKTLVLEGDNPNTEGLKEQLNKAEEIAKIAEERVKNINEEMGEYIERIEKEIKIEASLKISANDSFSEYSKEVSKGISVFDLMKNISDAKEEFSFEYKDSDLGVFIDEINGIENNAKDNIYWMFYVNDNLSEVSASEYVVMDNDLVEWRYEDATDLW